MSRRPSDPEGASAGHVMRVAVDVPLRRLFDYLPPHGASAAGLCPGLRVRVPFGRGDRIGVVLQTAAIGEETHPAPKRACSLLDEAPLWSAALLSVIEWAAAYYHHPIGEVVAAALPAHLRRAVERRPETPEAYNVTDAGRAAIDRLRRRAPRQAALLAALLTHDGVLPQDALLADGRAARATLKRMAKGGLIAPAGGDTAAPGCTREAPPSLSGPQAAAVESITRQLLEFGVFLLDGVTGSGKTEVYLRVIDAVLAARRQALVLVPEIGLTAQTVRRFQARFGARVALMHSGLGDAQRSLAYEQARIGAADIVIGTRSSIWVPLARPGIIIVDEEHDQSFKQQEGFRYSARDVAVMRARRESIPVVLGSATPSLESQHNARAGRYARLHLPARVGPASLPALQIIDVRARPLQSGVSEFVLTAISETVNRGEQALVFLNRRGYAPTLLCNACGSVSMCRRCDARMTCHLRDGRLQCHHCGAQRPIPAACEQCGAAELLPLGQGTERVAELLEARFGGARVVRIDRDTTRRRGALDAALEAAHSGHASILIGTQMLAKGHHFPGVSLVAVLNADAQLYSVDLRATERLAQLLVQVAGRAGRSEKPGTVLIQTRLPEHWLFEALRQHDYAQMSRTMLEERESADLPPFSALALVRAEATTAGAPERFQQRVADTVVMEKDRARCKEVEVFGPLPAPLVRRAGHFRSQLVLQSRHRQALHRLLDAVVEQIESWPEARRVRWSLDIDPAELY
ncbi:MAG: primosomal protein N' [Gammaproteobacteria bacterium]|nr:primosomal protein N' [Gammaproteobacteria bacterium]